MYTISPVFVYSKFSGKDGNGDGDGDGDGDGAPVVVQHSVKVLEQRHQESIVGAHQSALLVWGGDAVRLLDSKTPTFSNLSPDIDRAYKYNMWQVMRRL